VLKAYAACTTDEVYEAVDHLASARFISYGTWKWAELQMKTGGKPVYRYLYARPHPAYLGMPGEPAPAMPAARGAAMPAEGPVPSNHKARAARRIPPIFNTPWAT
jgi:para-nitrobenzyl esterase